MLCTLLVLHCYWTALLLKIAWKALFGSVVDDIREDSDAECDDEEEAATLVRKEGKKKEQFKNLHSMKANADGNATKVMNGRISDEPEILLARRKPKKTDKKN